ncbi:response regulator transcription factor [Erythrobacter sp. HA6-11]
MQTDAAHWTRAKRSGNPLCMRRGILRYGLIYGGALAAIAALLQWAQYRYLVMSMPYEAYIAVIASVFIAMGIWLGMQLNPKPRGIAFKRNEKAIESLKLTRRECEILDHLASGASNKEIARSLGVSPNTIKTHIANLYIKLGVSGRGKAVDAARSLALIP